MVLIVQRQSKIASYCSMQKGIAIFQGKDNARRLWKVLTHWEQEIICECRHDSTKVGSKSAKWNPLIQLIAGKLTIWTSITFEIHVGWLTVVCQSYRHFIHSWIPHTKLWWRFSTPHLSNKIFTHLPIDEMRHLKSFQRLLILVLENGKVLKIIHGLSLSRLLS